MENDLRRWMNLVEASRVSRIGMLRESVRRSVIAYHGTASPLRGAFRAGLARDVNENAIFFTSDFEEARRFPYVLYSANECYVYQAMLDVSRFRLVNYLRYQTELRALEGDTNYDSIYDPDIMSALLINSSRSDEAGLIITGIQNFEGGSTSTTYAVFDPAVIFNVKLMDDTDEAANDDEE